MVPPSASTRSFNPTSPEPTSARYLVAHRAAADAADYPLAIGLLDRALERLNDRTTDLSPEAIARHKKHLEGRLRLHQHWIAYRYKIQSQKAHPNWPAPPYDRYFTTDLPLNEAMLHLALGLEFTPAEARAMVGGDQAR